MLSVLVLAASVSTPQSSPPPLKTITNARSTPFCSAFENNIKGTVQGLLLNDDLFRRSEPVFQKAARDMVLGGQLESSFNSLHPATVRSDNPRVQLDMNRMNEIVRAVVHNLEAINALLNDAQRFPAAANSDEERRLVHLRDQLLAVAKQQNDELNVLSGTSEQYAFDQLYNAEVGPPGVFASDGKGPRTVQFFGGGPFNVLPQNASTGGEGPNFMPPPANLPTRIGDPQLLDNGIFMSTSVGRMYDVLVQRERAEAGMETQATQSLVNGARLCR